MADFTPYNCIVCGKKFDEHDDIVVCPECGTPYHRECYKKEGKCINTALHESGKSFLDENGTKEKGIICPRCHTENDSLAIFCDKCGLPIAKPAAGSDYLDGDSSDDENDDRQGFFANNIAAFDDPLCGVKPDENFDGVTGEEIASFVDKNTFYFMPVFKHMKDSGRKVVLNFSAMMFPSYYYAYRKMYAMMALSFIISLILGAPGFIVSAHEYAPFLSILKPISDFFDTDSQYFSIISACCSFLNYIWFFIRGTFSNWLYYRHCVNKIKKMKKVKTPAKAEYEEAGGVSAVSLVCYVTFSAVFVSGIIYLFFYLTTGGLF